jgi:tryptophan-rich sensory protein
VREAIRLAVSVALPLVVGGVSGMATAGSVADWYPTLEKPPFNPPAWVFGPVWTLLYIAMGIALYLVWRLGWEQPEVRWAVALFGVQLVLNGLWSVVFFGLRAPGLAFLEIALLWIAIGATVVAFWRLEPKASALLFPYWAWVSFAAVLNGSIWWLNR